MPNNFVWYELMTSDAKAAEAFYSKVVGWKTQDSGQAGMDYTLLLAGESPIAGLMTLPKEACDAGARPGWVGYIGVNDVDAYVSRVTKAGGAVHVPPTDIPKYRSLRHGGRSAGCGVQPLQAALGYAAAAGRSRDAGHDRLARADGLQRREGLRVLCRAVRLDQG
jgi:predicted enzyme related to lactoylglutathione lyase